MLRDFIFRVHMCLNCWERFLWLTIRGHREETFLSSPFMNKLLSLSQSCDQADARNFSEVHMLECLTDNKTILYSTSLKLPSVFFRFPCCNVFFLLLSLQSTTAARVAGV